MSDVSEMTVDPPKESVPPWTRFDTIAICAMLVAAIFAHFWQLGMPSVLVYDEHIYVEEAYQYLRGEAFFEIHPPLAILLIAACARLFGCHPWSWRISSAVIGSALIPLTYLLGRRMFHSRFAATLAALLVLCEGMFLQYSRLGLINIVYLTLGAAAYLALFRFVQNTGSVDRRRSLVWLGILLGLGLGSKFAIPAVTWMLVVGFLVGSILYPSATPSTPEGASPWDLGYIVGAVTLIGGISGIFFFLTFLPNYTLGWWSGISSLTTYYQRVLLANKYYPAPASHQNSPWWSWPLMLHAYRLWQQPDDRGMILAIWGGGNPAIWWASLIAILLASIRALRRSEVTWSFLSIGYVAYLAMWIPVHRAVYLYSYMPALYLGILAMAGLLDDCWRGVAQIWEQSAILLPVFAVSLLGLGYLYGAIASSLALAGFIALVFVKDWGGNWSGKFVCAIFVATSIAVFLYFLPIWIPYPLTQEGFDGRMWLNNAGLGKWI